MNIGLVGFYHDSNKGIDTAIEAVSQLHSDSVKLHILGNGNGQDREKWYLYAQNLGLSRDSLIFPEPIVGMENMFGWYDTMDIMILPSRSEGLPRTVVEAMSRACPCITSDVCGLSELCEPEWTHAAGDSGALARLMKKMLENPDEMKVASDYNFKRAENYLESVQLAKRINFMNEFKRYCEGKREA